MKARPIQRAPRAPGSRGSTGRAAASALGAVLALFFVVAGSPAAAEIAPSSTVALTGEEVGRARFVGTPTRHDRIVELLQTARPRQFKAVGTSSVVYRMRTLEDFTTAYRPRTGDHPRGHLSEIAAYRIGRLLGLDNVAPAVGRVLTRDTIRGRLDRTQTDEWRQLRRWTRWNEDGSVPGASIYWILEMRELGLDRPDGLRRWSGLLHQPEPDAPEPGPATRRDYPDSLLRDLSSCVAFDYLIGNWDRWSGANARGTRQRTRLFLRDHNNAFAVRLPRRPRERMANALERTERFSRGFVSRLRRLDRASIEAAFARDPLHAHTPLLTPAQLDAFFDRRATVLSYAQALIDQYGEDAVLSFE